MSRTHRFDTALGRFAISWGPNGITRIAWPGAPPGEDSDPPVPVAAAAAGIAALLGGQSTDLGFVALDLSSVSEFARAVYGAARGISPGATSSYGELAVTAGHTGAAREVGAALARNPFPIVVPCHRVLAADGSLHGFSAPGGIETKRRLLEIEGAPGFEQQPLFAFA